MPRGSTNVRVLARFRPSSEKLGHRAASAQVEKKSRKGKTHRNGSTANVDVSKLELQKDCKSVVVSNENLKNHRFTFDHIFQADSTQEQVFQKVAKDTVKDVLNGYNGTIFAYGQTGSGKTWTMFGDPKSEKTKGIIPRCCDAIFEGLEDISVDVEKVQIKVSFIQIYQETLQDLLNPTGKALRIRQKPNGPTYIEGAKEVYVQDPGEVLQLIEEGSKNKKVTATDMNSGSSRAHSVLMVNFLQTTTNGVQREGGLNLADLAGSERLSRTGAKGQAREEAKFINKSLSALGNCISALTSGSSKKKHIPFRDSKLTRILQDALGGNSKTSLVVCCSGEKIDITETISTLRFAERAKSIKNKAKVNEILTIEEYQKLVSKLRSEVRRHKKLIVRLETSLKSSGKLSSEQLEGLAELTRPTSAMQRPDTAVSDMKMEDASGDRSDDSVVGRQDNDQSSISGHSFSNIKLTEEGEVWKNDTVLLDTLEEDGPGGHLVPQKLIDSRPATPGSQIEGKPLPILSPENTLDAKSLEKLVESAKTSWGGNPTETPAKVAGNGPDKSGDVDLDDLLPPEPIHRHSPDELLKRLKQSAIRGDEKEFNKLVEETKDHESISDKSILALFYDVIAGGSRILVQRLIEMKANVSEINGEDGTSPLMEAVLSNEINITELLLQHKANVNATDSKGATALIHASKIGNPSLTQLLVLAKADINAKDGDGLTAKDITRQRAESMLKMMGGEKEVTLQHVEKYEQEVEKAIVKYEQDSQKGNPDATFSLAMCYLKGKGVTRNQRKAVELFSEESLSQYPKALVELGRCHLLGLGTRKNPEVAVRIFRQADKLGSVDGSIELAWCLAKKEGVEEQQAEIAISMFKDASEKSHPGGKCGIGYCYQVGIGGVEVDEERAVSLYEQSAEEGYAYAFTQLGKCFLMTKNNAKASQNQAFLLFKKAAKMKDRVGTYYLAKCYLRGIGVEENKSKAVELYHEASQLGDTESYLRLARCYLKGEGTIRDTGKAVRLLQAAVELGSSGAMVVLGDCYQNSIGVSRNLEKAAGLYQQAAARADPRAMLKLGECYENAKGVERNPSKAVDCYSHALEAGMADACARLGWCYAKGIGVKKDDVKAFAHFTKAMKRGSSEAVRGIGYCYEKGISVSKNVKRACMLYNKAIKLGNATAASDLAKTVVHFSGKSKGNQKAFELFQKSARMGDVLGNQKLAWCYMKGVGVERDPVKAVKYYMRAADMGDSISMSTLGYCYATGVGVRKDQVRSFEYFEKAADLGNPTDINNLGLCYKRGTGVPIDNKKAFELFQRAADLGDSTAYCNLGVSYYGGLGVEKDEAKAIRLWEKAASLGNPNAKRNLERNRKAKLAGNNISLYRSLAKLMPPNKSQKSVLDRRLFKANMTELSSEEQTKRRAIMLEAFKMTIERAKNKQKQEAHRRAASEAKAKIHGDAKTKLKNYTEMSSADVHLSDLIQSGLALLKLIAEPQKRTEKPELLVVKEVNIRELRAERRKRQQERSGESKRQ